MSVDRIKILRNEKGIKQEYLASLIGCARSTVAMWEKGRNDPPIHAIKAMIDFFGCTSDYLLGFSDNRIPPQALSEEESQLIAAYNSADDTAKQYALELLLSHPVKKAESILQQHVAI